MLCNGTSCRQHHNGFHVNFDHVSWPRRPLSLLFDRRFSAFTLVWCSCGGLHFRFYLFSREYLEINRRIAAAATPLAQINSFRCVNLLRLAISINFPRLTFLSIWQLLFMHSIPLNNSYSELHTRTHVQSSWLHAKLFDRRNLRVFRFSFDGELI